MKRLGARDFADLLQASSRVPCKGPNLNVLPQCAIPAFEGLMNEPHNSRMMDLIFTCATWHGLAQLRLHTDQTLKMLDKFNTRELPREATAHIRHTLLSANHTKKQTGALAPPSGSTTTQRPKALNLNTYKFHSIGDVAATIQRYGTMDSYSTEIVGNFLLSNLNSSQLTFQGELEHRTVEARYRRTDHKNISRQIARLDRHEVRLQKIQARITPLERADDLTASQAEQSVHHVIGEILLYRYVPLPFKEA
ncbi:hypothetical protein DXG01_014935 [Tephrocybe rancida]|nr:hypothetical protein DXG01_014935 [Tephrocybe rancida]